MRAAKLKLVAAGSELDPLVEFGALNQAQYLRRYLADLGAHTLLIEPQYFDRDYLSEFKSFYSLSSAGYPNLCQRIHYFSLPIDRALLRQACSGDREATRRLQGAYLGFIVRRPIPATPFGRTVVKWYKDETPLLPRVIAPSRVYESHVAGITLQVEGLAWQQQDTGVGACATIALWSMLHSSAFDDRHVVPTTAEVTRTAHRAGVSYQRLFPSLGLTFGQLVATLRDTGFAPLMVGGNLTSSRGSSGTNRFRREQFCSGLASFIRSGFPVLLGGDVIDQKGKVSRHAVCAVAFRQAASDNPGKGKVGFEDEATEYVYIHDDNLGPAVRFRVDSFGGGEAVSLKASSPGRTHNPRLPDPTASYPEFVPDTMLAAAHEEVRISPGNVHEQALSLGAMLIAATGKLVGFSIGSRIVRVAEYMDKGLAEPLRHKSRVLAKARLALAETVEPMSLHVALIRFAIDGRPELDVLCDTTDSPRNMRAFCGVTYSKDMADVVKLIVSRLRSNPFGVRVDAF